MEKRRRWERLLIINVAPSNLFLLIFLTTLNSFFQSFSPCLLLASDLSFLQLFSPGPGRPYLPNYPLLFYHPCYHSSNPDLQLGMRQRLRRSRSLTSPPTRSLFSHLTTRLFPSSPLNPHLLTPSPSLPSNHLTFPNFVLFLNGSWFIAAGLPTFAAAALQSASACVYGLSAIALATIGAPAKWIRPKAFCRGAAGPIE